MYQCKEQFRGNILCKILYNLAVFKHESCKQAFMFMSVYALGCKQRAKSTNL